MIHPPVGPCLLNENTRAVIFYEVSNAFVFFPLFLSVYAADEEKLDERAKLSVAAKRSLFRVSFNCCLFALSFLKWSASS